MDENANINNIWENTAEIIKIPATKNLGDYKLKQNNLLKSA
jgi:hypothetical protein